MRRLRLRSAQDRHGICRRVAVLLLSGLLVLVPSSAVHAQNASADGSAVAQRFTAHIADASRRFRIPEDWIRTVLAAESAHDIGAVSDAGAMGLMQIMPDTWDELSARLRLGDDAFDPRANILAGTAYLREMLDRYGDITSMLAAYNAGPGRYDEYLTTGRPLPAETVDYVAALVPMLGGEPLADGATTTVVKPADWRDAPLFVIPANSNFAVVPVQSDGQSE